jgi:hypothetical protein
MNRKLALLTLLLTAFSLPAAAQQQYPARAIRMVVGFPAGGPTDIVARQMAPKMSEGLGQQVIVDNRGGAGGMIATEQVAKAAPDGYTILMGTIGGVAVAMSLNPNRGYDTLRDLAPITQSVTVTSGSTELTRAVTVTGCVDVGTAGACINPSTVGAGAATAREFAAPGVPRVCGTGKRNTRPKLRSHVCATSSGIPETHRPSNDSVYVPGAPTLPAIPVTSISALFAFVSPDP